MKKLSLLTFIMLTFMCASCEDDIDAPKDLTLETKQYLPMQVGNYWIYDNFQVRDGVERKMEYQDTIRVISEVMIQNKKYYKFESTMFGSRFQPWRTLTDSCGYLVADNGSKFFSNILFDTVIREYHNLAPTANKDTIHSEYYKMRKIEQPVTTAVGKLNVLDLEDRVVMPQIANKVDRYTHCYFAKDIGIVFRTYTFITAPANEWVEQRLVKYCINGKTHPQE